MKRAISVVLTLAMLISLVAVIPVFTSSAAEHTLDAYNEAIEAYRFDGTVLYTPLSGSGARRTPFYWITADDDGLGTQTVKSGASDAVLHLDGIIEDGEWGTPSVTVSSKDAVEYMAGSTNLNYEYPNGENTLFCYYNNTDGLAVKDGDGLAYDVYFMWDEDYLYVGAKVYDPDGHNNNIAYGNASNLWQGDALQFRVDGQGPNSVVNGTGYDASVASPGDYSEDGEVSAVAFTFPWASTEKKSGQELYSEVCNMIIAYTTNKNGFTGIYDACHRYDPYQAEIKDETGAVTGTYTAYNGCSLFYYNSGTVKAPDWVWYSDVDEFGTGDMVYATVSPIGDSEDNGGKFGYETVHATTDYEVALPWSYVNIQSGVEIAPGLELGVAVGLLNRKAGTSIDGENSYLEWGNGIFPGRMSGMPQTCGGSNSMILSDVSYSEHEACTHDSFSYPTCEEPYVCTTCGYEKGYKSGHKYEIYEQVLPTTGTAGYAKAKCSTCGDEVQRELAATNEEIYANFYRTETTADSIFDEFSSGYNTVWFEREYVYNEDNGNWEAATDAAGNTINKNNNYRNADGSNKISYWGVDQVRPYCSLTLDDSDLIANPFGYAVLDFTSIDQTGTYLMVNDISPSYVYKQEFYFEGVYDVERTFDEDNGDINLGNSNYLDSYYFWCGGEGEIDYAVGLFKIEGEWYFAIIKSTSPIARETITLEDFKNYAIVCNKATDEQVKQDAWHEVVFFYDKDANVASLYWDDALVCGAYDEHFATTKTGKDGNSYVRPFNVQYYTTDIEIGTTSLASKYITASETPDVPVEPVTYTLYYGASEYGKFEEGEEISFGAGPWEGHVWDHWEVEGVEIADPTNASIKFTMPANDVTIAPVYYQVGDIDKSGSITLADIFAMKTAIVEAQDVTAYTDMNGDGTLNLIDMFLIKKAVMGN